MIDFKSVKSLVTAREAAELWADSKPSWDGLVSLPRRSQPQHEAGRSVPLLRMRRGWRRDRLHRQVLQPVVAGSGGKAARGLRKRRRAPVHARTAQTARPGPALS